MGCICACVWVCVFVCMPFAGPCMLVCMVEGFNGCLAWRGWDGSMNALFCVHVCRGDFCLEGLGHACFVCLYAGEGWLDGLGVGPMDNLYCVITAWLYVCVVSKVAFCMEGRGALSCVD